MIDSSRREFLAGMMGFIAGAEELDAANKKKGDSKSKKPNPLSGSKNSMERQRGFAEQGDLSYLQSEAELKEFVKKGLLVPLPKNQNITYDPYLALEGNYTVGKKNKRKYNRAYCRPFVKKFLEDLSRDYKAKFPNAQPLMVTSAVRPADVQRDLLKSNPNASKQSLHLTGAVIDIVYGPALERKLDGSLVLELNPKTKEKAPKTIHKNISEEQKKWIADRLKSLEQNQKTIEATLERVEPCFHIMVSKKYK
jgi:hypothetical protein